MSRRSLKKWAARLTDEEIDQIVKQALRDFKAEDARAELKKLLLQRKRPV
jgi:hypothetical protein